MNNNRLIIRALLILMISGCATVGNHYQQAKLHYNQGEYDAALTAYYQAAEQNPDCVEVQTGLADVFEKKGMKEETIKAWERALVLDSNHMEVKSKLVNAYVQQGLAYRKAGKVSDAYEILKKALKLDPDHIQANGQLAQLYSDQGDDIKAAVQYKKLTDKQPHDAGAYQALGLVYYKQGKIDEAIKVFQQVLRLNPQNARAFNNLGTAYLKVRQLENAIAAFEQAAGIDPNLVSTYNNWGSAYFQQGRYLKAREKWELSLRLDGTNQTAQKNLKTLETLGY